MEVNDIGTTFVPNLDNISQDTIDKLIVEKDTLSFLILNSPEIRDVDRIWAEELFGDEADDILHQAVQLLEFLANRRNP